MKRIILSTCVAVAVLLGGAADARGRVVAPEKLPDSSRVQLAAEIARARAKTPEAFTQLARALEAVPTLDARKRGRLAPVSPMLKRLGPDALWPMLERLAFDAKDAPAEASAQLALDVGLIEAVGYLRDPRSAPVWRAVLEGPETRPEVMRAAAGALARLDSDDAASALVAYARADGLRRDAALAMMGHCRRLVVARALADALKQPGRDVAGTKAILRSLGDVGNAWAWKTPAVKARAEEDAVRRTAAEALLAAYLAHEGELRNAAANALLVVDAPATPSLLRQAREAASDADRRALDDLAGRLENNPTR